MITNASLRKLLLDIYDLWTPDLTVASAGSSQFSLRFFESNKEAQAATSLTAGDYSLIVTDVLEIEFGMTLGFEIQEFISAYMHKGLLHIDFSVDTMAIKLGPTAEVRVESDNHCKNVSEPQSQQN